MSKGFSGLPDRPVTEAETQAIDQHPDFDTCHPMYQLVDDPESVVVIILKKTDRAYLLYFNSERQQWEQLLNTKIPESVTDKIPFEEGIVEEVNQHYDPEDLKPVGYPGNPVDGSVRNFPKQPLTDRQIETILERHPMINEVLPLVSASDSGGIIAGIFFFDDLIEDRRVTTAIGYEPEIGEWEVIASAESSDPQLDESLDGLETAYTHWVDNDYTMDMIQPIEDPEAAMKSASK